MTLRQRDYPGLCGSMQYNQQGPLNHKDENLTVTVKGWDVRKYWLVITGFKDKMGP